MIGGSGEKRTLRLVAQYADMCNVTRRPGDGRATSSTCCATHCDDVGRDPVRDHDDPPRHARAHRRRRRDRARHAGSCRDWPATSSTSSSPSASPTRSSREVERAHRRRARLPDLQHAALRPRHGRARPASCSPSDVRVACALVPATLAERLGYAPDAQAADRQLRRPRLVAARPTSRSTRRCATASRPARR